MKMTAEEKVERIRHSVISMCAAVDASSETYGKMPKWIGFLRSQAWLPFWVLGNLRLLDFLTVIVEELGNEFEISLGEDDK